MSEVSPSQIPGAIPPLDVEMGRLMNIPLRDQSANHVL